MSRRSYAKSQIFLMEFIVVVLFFALCAAICISAFVKADNISKESKELNHAILLAQSAAEALKALEYDEFGKLHDILGTAPVDKNTYRGFYTKNFKTIGAGISEEAEKTQEVVYVMEVTTAVKEKILTANVIVFRKESAKDKICGVEVKKYLPEEVSDDRDEN